MTDTFNFPEMENYCKARYQKRFFVKNGMNINASLFQQLKKLAIETSFQTVADCIESSPKNRSIITNFQVEFCCDECKNSFYKSLSKAKLVDSLKDDEKNVCPECEKIITERKHQEEFLKEALSIERDKKRTENFISSYLNPNNSWKKDIPPKKYYWLMEKEARWTNVHEVAEYINSNLTYKEFLRTPYWKAIAEKKKKDADYSCELCNSVGKLNVHHRTYERHGYERLFLKDLIVLCEDCHRKFHGIGDDNE